MPVGLLLAGDTPVVTYPCRAGRSGVVSRTVIYEDGGRKVVEVPAWARSADEKHVLLTSGSRVARAVRAPLPRTRGPSWSTSTGSPSAASQTRPPKHRWRWRTDWSCGRPRSRAGTGGTPGPCGAWPGSTSLGRVRPRSARGRRRRRARPPGTPSDQSTTVVGSAGVSPASTTMSTSWSSSSLTSQPMVRGSASPGRISVLVSSGSPSASSSALADDVVGDADADGALLRVQQPPRHLAGRREDERVGPGRRRLDRPERRVVDVHELAELGEVACTSA